MEWSFWERDLFRKHYDVLIIGGGFSGLATAYYLAKEKPALSIGILEKQVLQRKASTRNAGMACISSLSELLNDVHLEGWDLILSLVEKRWKGLELMRNLFPADEIHYRNVPAGELFFEGQQYKAGDYIPRMEEANEHLKSIVGKDYFTSAPAFFPSHSSAQFVKHKWEGQLHPARLCQAWMKKCREEGIDIMEGLECLSSESSASGFEVRTQGPVFSAGRLLWATNGAISTVYPNLDVKPVQNHVWVFPEQVPLSWEGNIHAESGYVYARSIGKKLLIGGARHQQQHQGKDLTDNGEQIYAYLLDFARQFLWENGGPDDPQPEAHWTGFLGVGDHKQPILEEIGEGEFILARLSGMGVALSTYLGREMAKRINAS